MSGHSKWSTIKHKKALTDKKRSGLFSKISKIISIAAKDDPNPDTNPKLKTAIDKARSVNMPKDNIERAINKTRDKDVAQLSEVQFDILGPSQVAIIVTAITDNSNRTLGEIRQILTKNNSKLADQGAISWMFNKQGVIRTSSLVDREDLTIEDIELQLIEAGAEDIKKDDVNMAIFTRPESLYQVKSAAEGLGLVIDSAEIEMVPTNTVTVDDSNEREKIDKLLEELDDHEEVNSIFSNLE